MYHVIWVNAQITLAPTQRAFAHWGPMRVCTNYTLHYLKRTIPGERKRSGSRGRLLLLWGGSRSELLGRAWRNGWPLGSVLCFPFTWLDCTFSVYSLPWCAVNLFYFEEEPISQKSLDRSPCLGQFVNLCSPWFFFASCEESSIWRRVGEKCESAHLLLRFVICNRLGPLVVFIETRRALQRDPGGYSTPTEMCQLQLRFRIIVLGQLLAWKTTFVSQRFSVKFEN